MKPHVVLDIAPLGWAWSRREDARGIHRVAERLLSGLATSGECEVSAVATSSVYGAEQYLRQTGAFRDIAFRHSRRHRDIAQWSHQLSTWASGTLPDRSLPTRARRFAAYRTARMAERIAARVAPDDLAAANIYHSPLAPIPRAIQRQNTLKRFLTVHDMIPLTHPETVNHRGADLLRRQIGSLVPGSFAFCVSNDVRNDLLNITRLPPDRVFVTHLAAAPEIFHPVEDRDDIRATQQKHGIPDEPYILALSSFDPRKNFNHLIECFGRLAESGELHDCNLVLVGSNPERITCIAAAISRFPKLKHRILTPGYIPDEDLAAIYSGALAFAFPSLSEGFGIPAVEAMRCGIPVISSNTTSLPEVVGDAGIMLDPRDADAWCGALRDMAANPALRHTLRLKSIERAKMFTWEHFIDQTLQGYRRSLQE